MAGGAGASYPAPMLGVGIVTYNRGDVLLGTVERVLRHTRAPFRLVVADDGSTDGTVEGVRDLRIPVITGRNAGVAWNKNRALFALRGCDPILLLEDDARPTAPGWEAPLIEGARRWGHVNVAGDWFAHSFVSGGGTPDDPILSRETSGQCSAFSAEALSWVGYLDTRFKGYGFEHIEHTLRFLRLGYGGVQRDLDGVPTWLFLLIRAPVEVLPGASSGNPEQAERNLALCRELFAEPTYRPAWRDDDELARLRAEIAGAALQSVP